MSYTFLSDDLADALGIPLDEADELIADVSAHLPDDLAHLFDNPEDDE